MRVYSQFPPPDFHRLDTRPYGLRTKDTKDTKSTKESKNKTFGTSLKFGGIVAATLFSMSPEMLVLSSTNTSTR